MPLGFRREMAGVRNAQLQLAKERAKLQEGGVGTLAPVGLCHPRPGGQLRAEPDDFNRRIAAQREVEAVTAAYETDTVTIDRRLGGPADAWPRPKATTTAALVDYNKSIAQVHYRKGSLLEYNGVYLAEGPWPGKAYFDARRRARARDAVDVSRLRLHAAEGHQPRADRAAGGRRCAVRRACQTDAAGRPRRRAPASRNWCRRPSRSRFRPARRRPSRSRPRPRPASRRRRSPPAARPTAAWNAPMTAAGDGERKNRAATVRSPPPAGRPRKRAATMNLARIHRLLQLIGLLQAGRGYNTDALAQACGVSRRTVFRDLDLLRLSGVPLAFDEKQQRYRIPGACLLPPTNFTPEEALSLLVLCHELGNDSGAAVSRSGPHRRGEARKQPAGPAPRAIARRDRRPPHPSAARPIR